MKSTSPLLLVLAAGIGSRYGGIKQLDTIGPNGESLMEYSIFDAAKAGFKKVVFVIKKDLEDLFLDKIINKYNHLIELDYVFQELDSLPTPYERPVDRKKPWGTGHAILAAQEKITAPFAVINADDFYGSEAFKIMKTALDNMTSESHNFCILTYKLNNTLSDHGSVSRGVCKEKDGFLDSITEHTKLVKTSTGEIIDQSGVHGESPLSPSTHVSMNFWGFSPQLFPLLQDGFFEFLKTDISELSSEFFITHPLDQAIQSGKIKISILETDEKWMGVTYKADKEIAQTGLKNMIKEGVYPANLV